MNCYRHCKEACDKFKKASCIYYMSEAEYKFRIAIKNRSICRCGGIMVSARFRGEEFNLCTSCRNDAPEIRKLMVG